MSRYYIVIQEDDEFLRVGQREGYVTEAEAVAEAKRHVDDALPHNTVLVLQLVGTAYLGGDGDTYYRSGQASRKEAQGG